MTFTNSDSHGVAQGRMISAGAPELGAAVKVREREKKGDHSLPEEPALDPFRNN
ncbi:MAG: hypothetical protein JRJ85_27845 [Deltaproteobacteria bacterium]|nr:hypothetical protein [Deltaproteobacteria bacterium]